MKHLLAAIPWLQLDGELRVIGKGIVTQCSGVETRLSVTPVRFPGGNWIPGTTSELLLVKCSLWTGLNGEVRVEQSPPALSPQEGKNCTIYCNYSGTTTARLYWYRQELGKSLEHLFSLVSNGIVKWNSQPLLTPKPVSAPCTSRPPRVASLPATSAPWTHSASPRLLVCTQSCSLGPRPHCCGTTVGGLVHRLCLSSCKEILKWMRKDGVFNLYFLHYGNFL